MSISLLDTLARGGLNTPEDAAQLQERELLAQMASQLQNAQQQAGTAQQAYQEAAAAPTPTLSPNAAFFPSLLGNIASVISGNQQYGQRAQETIRQSEADLLKRRADNLQALRDNYHDLADQAQKLGNLQAESEFRVKSEQIGRKYDELAQKQRDAEAKDRLAIEHANRLAEIHATGTEQLRVAQAKAKSDQSAQEQSDIETTADAINSGTMPLPASRGFSKNYSALLAALARRGVDVKKLRYEQYATDRFLSTVNGRQQVQIRQSAVTATEGIANLRALNDELQAALPRGKSNPLNRVKLNAARDWGVAPAEAQNAATKLRSQIADLVPELANIFQAGGVPTDRAMILADRALNENMSPAQLNAALDTVEKNIGYRLKSIQAITPITAAGQAPFPLAGQKMRALSAAQSGDRARFSALLRESPELDQDPALMREARRQGWIR